MTRRFSVLVSLAWFLSATWGSTLPDQVQLESKVLVDDSAYCPDKGHFYRVRNIYLQLVPTGFSKDRLVSLIGQFEPPGNPYDEVHVLVLSGSREADILLEPYIDTARHYERRRKLAEQFLGVVPIVAEYHRINEDAALFFSTGKELPDTVILEGENPYGSQPTFSI